MDKLKEVPHKSLHMPTPDQGSFEQYNYPGDPVKDYIVKFQKDYKDMLVEVLNRHGIPFSIDKYEEFIGKLHMIEISEPTINGQVIVIYYEKKEVCRLKKWLEWDEHMTQITQHIVEEASEGTELKGRGNEIGQTFIDEFI